MRVIKKLQFGSVRLHLFAHRVGDAGTPLTRIGRIWVIEIGFQAYNPDPATYADDKDDWFRQQFPDRGVPFINGSVEIGLQDSRQLLAHIQDASRSHGRATMSKKIGPIEINVADRNELWVIRFMADGTAQVALYLSKSQVQAFAEALAECLNEAESDTQPDAMIVQKEKEPSYESTI